MWKAISLFNIGAAGILISEVDQRASEMILGAEELTGGVFPAAAFKNLSF